MNTLVMVCFRYVQQQNFLNYHVKNVANESMLTLPKPEQDKYVGYALFYLFNTHIVFKNSTDESKTCTFFRKKYGRYMQIKT